MPLKKQERKEAYIEIINAMGKSQHKEAWSLMLSLTGKDTGLFIFSEYEKVVEHNKQKES